MSLHPLAAYQAPQPGKVTQQFVSEVRDSINNAIQCTPYRETHVIAFHWENDDLNVVPLEQELLDVFKNIYHFHTTSFTIPLVDSWYKLVTRLGEWSRQHQGPDILRIFVYSGHAHVSGLEATSWRLRGNLKVDPNTGRLADPDINWWTVRDGLESIPGESCYIFDCCSAASGALSQYNGAEFMAACPWDQTATAILDISFTRILIDTLRALNDQPQTLATIYSRMFRFAQETHIGACPVHVPKIGSRSVTIGRSLATQRVSRSMNQNSYRVLISVRVRGDVPQDRAQWTAWLARNIPHGILSTDVALEGSFHGSGTMLVTVPVEIWTMLPRDDPAYTFIAHVSTHNLLQLTGATTLPIRSPPPFWLGKHTRKKLTGKKMGSGLSGLCSLNKPYQLDGIVQVTGSFHEIYENGKGLLMIYVIL